MHFLFFISFLGALSFPFLPHQQWVEWEEPAFWDADLSLWTYAEQRRKGAVLLLSSPRWVVQQLQQLLLHSSFYPKLNLPVVLHPLVKGEEKSEGKVPRGKGTPFTFSQPGIMLQEASCGTASLHASVLLGAPHPLPSWWFYDIFFSSSNKPRG